MAKNYNLSISSLNSSGEKISKIFFFSLKKIHKRLTIYDINRK